MTNKKPNLEGIALYNPISREREEVKLAGGKEVEVYGKTLFDRTNDNYGCFSCDVDCDCYECYGCDLGIY